MTDITSLPGFYEMLFGLSGDGCYALDRDAGRFIAVNEAFCRMLGYSREELLNGEITPQELVAPEYRERVRALDSTRRPVQRARIVVDLLRKNGRRRTCEITLHNVDFGGARLRIGSARDITKRRRLQDQLERQIELQRKKTMETARATLRIYQLTEKLRLVPQLATMLLAADSEPELVQQAATLLTERTAFNYRDVGFYLRYGQRLLRIDRRERAIGVDSEHKIARAFRGLPTNTRRGEALLPIIGRGRTIGILCVQFDPDEYEFFARNKAVLAEQFTLLETITDIVALAVLNLRLLKKVERQSVTDQLTACYNRRFMERRLHQETERARRYERPLSLILADLDNLKEINDDYGHGTGDVVLRLVAQQMMQTSRTTDSVCRYGGDEFVVILPETTMEEAAAKAETLRHHLESLRIGPQKVSVTASIGVASFDGRESSADLLRRADAAMYAAKEAGKNAVHVAS